MLHTYLRIQHHGIATPKLHLIATADLLRCFTSIALLLQFRPENNLLRLADDVLSDADSEREVALALEEEDMVEKDNEREIARALAEEEGLTDPQAALTLVPHLWVDAEPVPEDKVENMSRSASVQVLQNMIRGRQRLLLLQAQEVEMAEAASKTASIGSLQELLASDGESDVTATMMNVIILYIITIGVDGRER